MDLLCRVRTLFLGLLEHFLSHKIYLVAFQNIALYRTCFLNSVSTDLAVQWSVQLPEWYDRKQSLKNSRHRSIVHPPMNYVNWLWPWLPVSATTWYPSANMKPTFWLLPGSLMAASCSSLYLSNAGPSSETRFGVSIVKALISGNSPYLV